MASIREGSKQTVTVVNSAAAFTHYVGPIGELDLDSTNMALIIHDGATSGGIRYQASAAIALSAGSTSAQIITKINELITNLTTAKLMT